MFTLFGIYREMPKTMVELVACWQGKFGRNVVIGWLSLIAWCSAFGRREITGALRIQKGQ